MQQCEAHMGHHYVSRFYLEKFTFNKKKTLVCQMTRNGMIPIKPNHIADICQKRNYNTPEQEREQSQLENKQAVVLRNFIKTAKQGRYDFSDEFIKLVTFMIANNRYTRQIIIRAVGDEFESSLGIPIDREYRGKFDLSFSLSKVIFDQLKAWEFIAIKERDNKKVFITSDNPITIFNPDDRTLSVGGSIVFKYEAIENISTPDINAPLSIPMNFNSVSFDRDAALIIPINPNICVIGFSKLGGWKNYIENHERDLVHHVNFITLAGCHRAVYSSTQKMLEVTKQQAVFNMTHNGW